MDIGALFVKNSAQVKTHVDQTALSGSKHETVC